MEQAHPAKDESPKNEESAQALTKETQQTVKSFLEGLNSLESNEEKLRSCLDYMREALSQSGSPRFKDFWEAKNACIELFKDKVNPSARAVLWGEYRELADEAKKLKDVLDQNAAFAVEQISLAIKAIRDDLESGKASFDLNLELPCEFLNDRINAYQKQQGKLHLLNALSLRVNELRKELMKTEMRIRQKNALFGELSELGDKIFPPRKDLIKELSDLFMKDVAQFVDAGFTETGLKQPFYVLREEIKGLQSFMRKLTLNTKAFTETRSSLSQCWDRVREAERERKKQRANKKEEFQKNFDEVLAHFREVQTAYEKGEVDVSTALEQLDSLLKKRDVDLGRDERKQLKKEHQEIAKPLVDKKREQQEAQVEKEQQKQEEHAQKLSTFKEDIQTLLNQNDPEIAALENALGEFKAELKKLQLRGADKREVQKLLRDLKDRTEELKEEACLSASGVGLDELNKVLGQKEDRRREIKAQLEEYRKLAGGSGMDFAQAMTYQELVTSEKQKLENVDESISKLRKQMKILKAGS